MTLSLWARFSTAANEDEDTPLLHLAESASRPFQHEMSIGGWKLDDGKPCPLNWTARDTTGSLDTAVSKMCDSSDTAGDILKQWFLVTVTVNSTTNTSRLYLNGDISRDYRQAVIPKKTSRHIWIGRPISNT